MKEAGRRELGLRRRAGSLIPLLEWESMFIPPIDLLFPMDSISIPPISFLQSKKKRVEPKEKTSAQSRFA